MEGFHRQAEPTKQEIFETQIARFYEYIEHITNKQVVEMTAEQKRQALQEKCPFERFRDALYDIFGDEIKVDDIKVLYRRLSANPEAEVDWSEVFGYGDKESETAQWRMDEAREKQGDDIIDDDKVIVTKLRRQVADAAGGGSKRRDIVKQIIYVPQADNYVVTSQHGLVQVLSAAKYNTITSMNVQNGDMITTGCCFLPNLRRLAIATDRQLCIWDYRSPSRESFVISPFPANLLCIAPITADPLDSSPFEDAILFGDVEGCVGILKIHQKDLSVKSPHKKGTGSEDRNPADASSQGGKKDGIVHVIDIAGLNTPLVRKKVHNDWTVKVVHCPDLKMFGSCSPNTKTAFIAEDMISLKSDKPYPKYVTCEKGCNTFTYSDRSNIFVTGGADKILRIWHPGIYTKPAGKLYGHIFSIVDIAVNDADQHIISLSSARLIRVWDIHTLTALQVFGDNENRPGERRIHCMLYDHKNEVLLTGSSVVDEWPLARKYHATILVPQTHPYAVLMMCVNEPLGQLLTSDTSPQIRVWEIESGRLLAQVNSPHGENIEVVAAAFDPTGFRLCTGGMNGSLRIWDFGSTQILKKYDPFQAGDDKEIIDLRFYERPVIPGVNYVIGLGWGGKLKIFRDSNTEYELVELCDFSDPNMQEPDMLFTPLIDDPEEARRSVLAKKQEEDKMHIRQSPQAVPGALSAGGDHPQNNKPKPKRQVQIQEQDAKSPDHHVPETDAKTKRSFSNTTLSLLMGREKSNVEEILRHGYNRGLYLSEDRRTLITGTIMGHLCAWDMRTMQLDVRWRLPISNLSDGPNSANQQHQNNKDTGDSQQGSALAKEKSYARDDFIPTPVSHTSMVNLSKYELHRVNALVVVNPALPEKKKKMNEEGIEVTDEDSEDDEDLGSRPGTGTSEGPTLTEAEIGDDQRIIEPAPTQAAAPPAPTESTPAAPPVPVGDAPVAPPANKPNSGVKKKQSLLAVKQEEYKKHQTEEEDDDFDEELNELFMGMMEGNVLYRKMTLLVSAHQDSWIRFWTIHKKTGVPNRIIHKVQMEINNHPSAVTCLASDDDSKFLAAGDYKGYVCTWTMQLALPSHLKAKIVKHGLTTGRRHSHANAEPKLSQLLGTASPFFSLKFRVSWRAHNVKVEDIFYYKPHDVLFTASTDSSVRIWKGFSSKYLGFFGQPQPFVHTGKYYGPLTQPVLPDIDDKPVYPVTSEKVLERKRAARKIRDLPLIVDRSRWNRATSGKDPNKKRFWQPKMVKDQYFNLLIKPKPPAHLQTHSTTSLAPIKKPEKAGIYRSLMTYGVVSTDHVNPRAIDFGVFDKKDDK